MSFENITDLPESMQHLVYELNQDNRNPDHWQQLGTAFLALNDEARARVCFQQCLEYDPDNALAQRHLSAVSVLSQDEVPDIFEGLEKIEAKLDAAFPAWFQIALAVLSFLFTAMLVFFQEWQIKEMVWGFWITSLSTGYAIILTSITGAVVGVKPPPGGRLAGVAPISNFWGARLAGGLFMLAFFTVHFGMFHLVIGQFLYGFFPAFTRSGLSQTGFANFPVLIIESLRSFWPLVLLSFASQIGAFRRAWQAPIGNAVAEPYKNVIRMHLSIFALAFFSIAGRDEWMAVVVLLFYYFPWGLVLGKKWMNQPEKKAPAQQ